ncbi:MAG: hypothetical protein KDD84_18755, partial [Caldilineaceae bacterium]|nr:hypothetical protein [Caldilineaceae bacterium]
GFGELIDPGQDTMIDCILDWGDGTSDYCYNVFDVAGRTLAHKYGPNYVNPTLTVNVEDEDGIFVAASKTLTVTGATAALQADNNSISGYENEMLTNTGAYSPRDATLTWSASEGTVIDEGDGVWSWSLPAGSAEGSRTVTINGGAQQTSFTVTVNGDGAPSDIEDGAPNSGDGNDDGIPDKAQMNVASLPSPITGEYITLVASPNMKLTNVGFAATPSVGGDTLPDDVEFSLGFPTFSVSGMGAGGSAVVTLYVTDSSGINSYRKYDSINGWYKFLYDDATATGAELLSNRILLYFVDGGRGDSDLSANGIVTDPGGPVYERPSYDLTVAVSGGGSVSQPAGTFVEGTVLTLTATADPGWVFAGWGGALGGNLLTQALTMDGDKHIVALFTRNQYSLARRVVGSGSISATPNQGSYLYGDVVALTATPTAGWHFGGWSGDLAGSNTTENITIGANTVVTATFTQNSYTVSAGVSGSGSVTLNPQQDSYVYGDVVLVEAVPAPGYVFQSWSGDLNGEGSGRQLLIDGNKALTAHFAPATYVIETAVTGSGSITLDPAKATYAYGDVVQVSAVAATGWRLTAWAAGLSGDATVQTLTVTDDMALLAIFAQDGYVLNVGWIGDGAAQKLTDQSAFALG